MHNVENRKYHRETYKVENSNEIGGNLIFNIYYARLHKLFDTLD